ncbi:YtxH domain-containing protein [Evansella halocellulosilytica]|uniref:YtxH domain-containing protein n=1 Tax=Evansella halocellulosilytica TaxID=2011013 RepID=UPI000BB9926F|nr:YtxH domain-containing protein [Evansella halocellulosilytica]
MSNDNQGLNTKDFLIGSLLGGIIGASTALLLAPKSGKELRQDLNEQAKVAKEKTADWTTQAVEKGNEFAAQVSDQSVTLIDKVKDVARSVRKDVEELTESADFSTDLEGVSKEIADSVKKEVEDLQRSVEQLVKEVEEKERQKAEEKTPENE